MSTKFKLCRKSAVVLFSGGMDSTYMCWELLRQKIKVYPLTAIRDTKDFDIANRALDFLNDYSYSQYLRPISSFVCNIPSLGDFVPGRNLYYLVQAMEVALALNAKIIGIGSYEDDGYYPDSNTNFIQSFRKMLRASGVPLKVLTLKSCRTKEHVVNTMYRYNCLDAFLESVRWCYKYSETKLPVGGYGCGKCTSCKIFLKTYTAWKRRLDNDQ